MLAREQKQPQRLSSQDWESLKRSENAQREFRDSVLQQKSLSEKEKTLTLVESAEEFEENWKMLVQSKGHYDDAHGAGCGLFMKRYQESGDLVFGFLKDFSPIVETIKDCAPPYGGIALCTISILFIIARNKNGIEATLASTLKSIRDRLPGIEMYRRIYDEDHSLDKIFQGKLVLAYTEFIDFCIAATKYYMGSGFKRFLRALAPSNTTVSQAAISVQDAIVEIKLLGEELLAKNVDKIKQSNEDLQQEVLALQDQLTDKELDDFRRTFSLEGFSESFQEEDLKDYISSFHMDRDINSSFLQQIEPSHLSELGVFQEWDSAKRSTLLILCGKNCYGAWTDNCWLSKVAFFTIEARRRTHPQHHAYYIFPRTGAPIYQALPAILLQLLWKNKASLRIDKERDALRAELHKFRSNKSPQESHKFGNNEQINMLFNIASRVVRLFDKSQTLYITVDRSDRCLDYNQYDHRERFLDGLQQMVRDAHCCLKVLVVFNESEYDVEQERDRKADVVIHKMRQKPLGDP
ncbi:uncharacterized protein N7511_001451 [Penicillium nucicola]|uniref:uncharacterized protein n=1 Tax=Penicillium nucicola TaxID=1850975 RepID=UPI0025458E6C|nr:uncharacterized protein N7511_001451 [Penicillium nucicola]KAJ5776440.1 hypothetical protein N7511_001451 [Penicillium nucicola]